MSLWTYKDFKHMFPSFLSSRSTIVNGLNYPKPLYRQINCCIITLLLWSKRENIGIDTNINWKLNWIELFFGMMLKVYRTITHIHHWWTYMVSKFSFWDLFCSSHSSTSDRVGIDNCGLIISVLVVIQNLNFCLLLQMGSTKDNNS